MFLMEIIKMSRHNNVNLVRIVVLIFALMIQKAMLILVHDLPNDEISKSILHFQLMIVLGNGVIKYYLFQPIGF